jgi:hypothetical protein
MELSFNLNIPAHELAERLPYNEFVLYDLFAQKRMLPTVRHEMHLAQMALQINRLAGGDAEFRDFLFQPKEEIEELKEFFEFKPRAK